MAGRWAICCARMPGRTLGLRFDLRKDAPDAASVGFVLAMLLKAQTREFRDFGVIVK